jgi:hypothetical protein
VIAGRASSADQLRGSGADRYRRLLDRYGPPEPSTGTLDGGFYAPPSPATPEELTTLDADELIVYLEAFEPTGNFLEPSKSGLARALTDVVASDPARYLTHARRLGQLDPEYAHAATDGVCRAVSASAAVNWSAVLELCEAVVAHPRFATDGDEPGYGWRPAQMEVIRLLGVGLAGDLIDLGDRARVFAIIEALAADPHPSPSDEEAYGPPNMSAEDLAANCVRSRAIMLAVDYGIWVYRHDPGDAFSEITALLEDHLDPSVDPSVAVRAAIGAQFPNLVAFDRTWSARAAGTIFPAGADGRPLWEAACSVPPKDCEVGRSMVDPLGRHVLSVPGSSRGAAGLPPAPCWCSRAARRSGGRPCRHRRR